MKKLPILAMVLLACTFARGQQAQTQAAPDFAVNARYLQGYGGGGYKPSCTSTSGKCPGSDLVLHLAAGTANCSGTLVEYAGGTLTLTNSATNYVFLDPSASCAPAKNTSGFTFGTILLYKAVTSGGVIQSIDDVRTPFAVSQFAVTGNTSVLASWSGSATAARCVHTDANGNLTVVAFDCGSGTGSVTTTGSPASGNLTKFSGSTSITNGDLSGDATTSGTLAVTVSKINGTSFAGTNGNLVKFGASNVPADSSVVAANVVVASSPGAGIARFAGSTQTATSAELSGDVTTSGSNAATVVKVNGIAYSATAAAHSVEVITSANTTATAKAIPDCTDTGGNHLNFTQSTDAFSCGTSGSGTGLLSTTSYQTQAFMQDEFCSNLAASDLGWTANGGGGSYTMLDNNSDITAAHPCSSKLVGGSTSSWEYIILGGSNTSGSFTFNPQAITGSIVGIVDNQAGTVGVVRFGMFDNRGIATPTTNAVYFEAAGTGSTPNWHCKTMSGGVSTDNDSGITAATNTWRRLQIDTSASSTVVFKIAGSTVCTNSSNVPNAVLTPAFESLGNASGTATLLIDYFSLTFTGLSR